jgi:hypothetical protein
MSCMKTPLERSRQQHCLCAYCSRVEDGTRYHHTLSQSTLMPVAGTHEVFEDQTRLEQDVMAWVNAVNSSGVKPVAAAS